MYPVSIMSLRDFADTKFYLYDSRLDQDIFLDICFAFELVARLITISWKDVLKKYYRKKYRKYSVLICFHEMPMNSCFVSKFK